MLMGQIASYMKKIYNNYYIYYQCSYQDFYLGYPQPLLLENRGLGGKEGRQSDQ